MGVLVEHVQNGNRMLVESDVLDIGRRIAQGDELWRGDPSMGLFWNPVEQMFEVWGEDIAGTPYLAAAHTHADARLVMKLVEGDWQKGLAKLNALQAAEVARKADEERRVQDQNEELADKLHWALRRDIGHMEGGLTKRLIPVPDIDLKEGA